LANLVTFDQSGTVCAALLGLTLVADGLLAFCADRVVTDVVGAHRTAAGRRRQHRVGG
jgi:hypothetical protein